MPLGSGDEDQVLSHRKPQQDLEEIARRVVDLARNRHGRLAAVSVALPEGMNEALCAELLRGALAEAGYAGVTVDLVYGEAGANVELLSLEFQW